jgi:hypothetical protein
MTIIFAILFGAIVFSHMAPFPFLMEAFRPSQSLWRVPQPNGGRAIMARTWTGRRGCSMR